jgi:HD-GYP domain-containing protein (c-di-GMP phosphodiesterase class II)
MEALQTDLHSEIRDVVANLSGAITSMRLYPDQHPQVQQYLENAHFELTKFLLNKEETTLLLVNDRVVCNQEPLPDMGPHAVQFIRTLREAGIERVTFVSGITKEVLQGFLRDLIATDQQTVRGQEHVKLGKLDIRVDFGDVDPLEGPLSEEQQEQIAAMNTLCRARLEDIKEIYDKIARQQAISARGLGEVVNTFVRAFAHGVSPIRMLASLKSADEYTFTHVVNVCILTMSQAEALGFRGKKLYEIGMASALHDAGKLLVPEEILTKPGAFTPEERAIMESHTIRGARYILGLEGVPKLSVLAALEHHLRFDGSGYPQISKEWRPNLVSQMLAISDVFDAMRSRRCYKEPKPLPQIVDILVSEKGTTFNPYLIENFLKLIKHEPR